MRLSAPFAAVMLLTSVARADYESEWPEHAQCLLVPVRVADLAVALINAHPDVVFYCQPCGDRAPRHHDRKPVASRPPADDTTLVFLAPITEIDLAYTYIRVSRDRYENVAALAGCRTTGVSQFLRVDGPLLTPEPTNIVWALLRLFAV
jgi:hypothetical protein